MVNNYPTANIKRGSTKNKECIGLGFLSPWQIPEYEPQMGAPPLSLSLSISYFSSLTTPLVT